MKGKKTIWSQQMIGELIKLFPCNYNKVVAQHFDLSQRTIIRKARELELQKEPDFVEKRKPELIQLSKLKRKPNPHKGEKGWSVPGSEKYRYKKGNIPATKTNKELVERIHIKRNQTIKRCILRRKYGLTPITKLNLKHY